MTVALAWVATRSDGREDLYFASDSRTRGVRVLDLSPKIMTLPRSDSALCFAGDTSASYPLMLQIANAIAGHQPARERNLDIIELKAHLLRVLTDIMGSVRDSSVIFSSSDTQLIYGGFSWRAKAFRVWTIYYEMKTRSFRARIAENFHRRLNQAAFIGDSAKRIRAEIACKLNSTESDRRAEFEPLQVLADFLLKAGESDSIGGSPQLVRIGPHMNTRPLCVLWGEKRYPTLFGRSLFDYENCDYWIIDPFTGKIKEPRAFGRRDKPEVVK